MHLVADLALEMSSGLAIMSLSHAGSKHACCFTKLMSIFRKLVVVEGCVIFLGLTCKAKLLACSNHGVDVGTHWGVWSSQP